MGSRYEAVLDYLQDCPALQGALNFQAAKAGNDVVQILTEGGDAQRNRRFVDGSVEKRFDFTIAFYKPVNYDGFVVDKGAANINLEGILNIQELIEWLNEQNRKQNFPDFGKSTRVEKLESMNNEPALAWIDGMHYSPPMAKYTITVRVEYMDYSDAI